MVDTNEVLTEGPICWNIDKTKSCVHLVFQSFPAIALAVEGSSDPLVKAGVCCTNPGEEFTDFHFILSVQDSEVDWIQQDKIFVVSFSLVIARSSREDIC